MKKILLPLAAVLLLAVAVPAFAELELGFGLTPSQDIVNQPIINFHVGYNWSILYFSWDAYAMPDSWVYNATTYTDAATGSVVPGYLEPGFLNLFDFGLKLQLRPVIGYAEIGTNYLYLRGDQSYGGIGVNARAGVGLKFRWWGINVSGTQIFTSWNDLEGAFYEAAHGNWSDLTQGSVLSFNFCLYF